MKLSELVTIRIGGDIKYFRVANSSEQLVEIVQEADLAQLPLLVLGHGSNIVPSDAPFQGVIVVDQSTWAGSFDKIPAGVALDEVVQQAISATAEIQLVNPEIVNLSGIPGTIGAAVVQNSGAYGVEIADFIQDVEVYNRANGIISTLKPEQLGFSYRNSMLKRSIGFKNGYSPQFIILSVALKTYGKLDYDTEIQHFLAKYGEIASKREQLLTTRHRKGMLSPSFPFPTLEDAHDIDRRSCGSFFTNPIVPADFPTPEDCPTYLITVNDSNSVEKKKGKELKKISAAWLIEQAGFSRGYKLTPTSDACLSSKHALAIVNAGNATKQDVQELMQEIQCRVQQKFQVQLEPEPIIIS